MRGWARGTEAHARRYVANALAQGWRRSGKKIHPSLSASSRCSSVGFTTAQSANAPPKISPVIAASKASAAWSFLPVLTSASSVRSSSTNLKALARERMRPRRVGPWSGIGTVGCPAVSCREHSAASNCRQSRRARPREGNVHGHHVILGGGAKTRGVLVVNASRDTCDRDGPAVRTLDAHGCSILALDRPIESDGSHLCRSHRRRCLHTLYFPRRCASKSLGGDASTKASLYHFSE
jgi:hypothetical protein